MMSSGYGMQASVNNLSSLKDFGNTDLLLNYFGRKSWLKLYIGDSKDELLYRG